MPFLKYLGEVICIFRTIFALHITDDPTKNISNEQSHRLPVNSTNFIDLFGL